MTAIGFQVLGIGAWGPGFQNWADLSAILNGECPQDSDSKNPKPEVIPANERRRAPLPVRLAVESSWQAVANAGLDPADLPSVFVSGIGDTQLTDYMCKVLAGENKALSPTKFHNSVHNAAAGYWTISTGCTKTANSVAGFQESVSLAMMEALIQCQTECRPILITFYDAPSAEVLSDLLKSNTAFAASLVIAPANYSKMKPNHSAKIKQQAAAWQDFDGHEILQNCYQKNPAARILPLLESMASHDPSTPETILQMPTSPQSCLELAVATPTVATP